MKQHSIEFLHMVTLIENITSDTTKNNVRLKEMDDTIWFIR